MKYSILELQFCENLVDGKVFDEKSKSIPDKPQNRKIKFDSSDDEDEDHSVEETNNGNDAEKGEAKSSEQQQEVMLEVASKDGGEQVETDGGSAPKKQCIEDPLVSEQTEPIEPTDDKPTETTADKPKESTDKPTESSDKPKVSNNKPKEFNGKQKASNEKSIDDLIDEDLKQLGDRKKVCLFYEFIYSLRYVGGAHFCLEIVHMKPAQRNLVRYAKKNLGAVYSSINVLYSFKMKAWNSYS